MASSHPDHFKAKCLVLQWGKGKRILIWSTRFGLCTKCKLGNCACAYECFWTLKWTKSVPTLNSHDWSNQTHARSAAALAFAMQLLASATQHVVSAGAVNNWVHGQMVLYIDTQNGQKVKYHEWWSTFIKQLHPLVHAQYQFDSMQRLSPKRR